MREVSLRNTERISEMHAFRDAMEKTAKKWPQFSGVLFLADDGAPEVHLIRRIFGKVPDDEAIDIIARYVKDWAQRLLDVGGKRR